VKKLWMVVLVLVVGALAVEAGGPPGGGEGRGRPGGDRRGRDMRGRFMEMMRGRGEQIDVFDIARRLTDLNEEQTASVQALDDQRYLEEAEALDELRRQLDIKYVALIIEILPGDAKEPYKKVYDAMVWRQDQRAAARKELVAVLGKLRTDQGVEGQGRPDSVPFSKTDIIRRYMKLTDEQRTEAEEVRREGFAALREQMRDVERPNDWRDAEAVAKFMDGMRKARETVDVQAADAMVAVLTDEQKKAYAPAATGYDAYRAKLTEIDATYNQKLIEAAGEEKAKELQQRRMPFGGGFRGRPGGDRGGRGGGQPGQDRPRPGADF